MTLQRQGVRTTGFTITNASLGIYPPSTVRAAVIEFGIIQATATAQSLGLGRPASIGTPTTNLLMQTDDPADSASVVNVNLTWSVQPGAPTTFHERWNSAATIGVGVIWTYPRGLIISASGALVLWNITAAVACDVNMIMDA